jgi:tetratricopeptide (TPR) repeat protein
VPASDRIDELKKRYDENPRRFFASLANEYRKAGDLEQAISLCQTHLAEQPANMNGHVVYGQALFEAGRYDEAKDTFEAALALDPENLIALRHLGDIACTNGANEKAREWYERVLDADPRNDEIIALLANLETEAKKSAVASPTPVVPLEAVATLVPASRPAAPPPPSPPRESLGLMDLAIDVDSPADAALDTAPAAPARVGDIMTDPFAEPSPIELQPWDPPAVDVTPALSEPEVPIAEAAQTVAYDDNIDMLFGESVPTEPAAPFVTETMAELYLQQGFTAEALEVYRQLSAADPGDESLKQRVRNLERGDRVSVPLAVVSEVEPERSSPALTARSYFAGLAARRAVQGNGRAHAAPETPAPRVSSPRVSSPRVSSPRVSGSGVAAPMHAATTVTSLDELFAGGPISPEDEHLALAFAQVAGAVEMGGASVQGRPTAPAESELSLDSVFRDADARVTGTVPRQSQTLRFDQFFSTAGEESAPPPRPVSAPVGEPGSPAEIQQFQSWLTALKKP